MHSAHYRLIGFDPAQSQLILGWPQRSTAHLVVDVSLVLASFKAFPDAWIEVIGYFERANAEDTRFLVRCVLIWNTDNVDYSRYERLVRQGATT